MLRTASYERRLGQCAAISPTMPRRNASTQITKTTPCTIVIIAMESYLADLGAWVTVVQGAIFVLCVLAFRRGIVGEIGHFLKKPL